MDHTPDLRGEVVDFEVKVKYELGGEIDYKYVTLVYKDGRKLTFRGGDHGNVDPWVYIEGDSN